MYAYFLETANGDLVFRHWNDKMQPFEYEKDTPYFNLLVPTVDTVRYSFITQNLILNKNNVYLTGLSGTGKVD